MTGYWFPAAASGAYGRISESSTQVFAPGRVPAGRGGKKDVGKGSITQE